MKKIKHGCGEYELHISRIFIDYTQNGDSCMGGAQTLTVSTDDAGGGVFFRIDTNGNTFAFDNIEDITNILQDFKNRIQ